jgi:transposase
MDNDLGNVPRPVRRRLLHITRKSRDPLYVRRAMVILMLIEGVSVSEVARNTQIARSSIQRWKYLFITYGEAGLVPQTRGPKVSTVTDELITLTSELLKQSPTELGFLRSTWTSELLAKVLGERGHEVHASTIRRLLKRIGYAWSRARPTLCIRDPLKAQRMKAINAALKRAGRRDTAVLYVDEADVDLNPRIGPVWTPLGQQVTVPTPGKNRKQYVAGALDAHSGAITFVDGESKNTDLFLRLLEAVERAYAKTVLRIYIILDNFIIHKSRLAQAWCNHHPRIRLLFQPAYHPWVNDIEKLWKAMHDTVTRNHRHSTLNKLMIAVRRFLTVAAPFPGGGHALARA